MDKSQGPAWISKKSTYLLRRTRWGKGVLGAARTRTTRYEKKGSSPGSARISYRQGHRKKAESKKNSRYRPDEHEAPVKKAGKKNPFFSVNTQTEEKRKRP